MSAACAATEATIATACDRGCDKVSLLAAEYEGIDFCNLTRLASRGREWRQVGMGARPKPPSPAKVLSASSTRSVAWLGASPMFPGGSLQLRGSAGIGPAFPIRIEHDSTRSAGSVNRRPRKCLTFPARGSYEFGFRK